MRLLEINVCSGCKSTGRIASDIAKQFIDKGHEAVIAYGRGFVDCGIETYKIASNWSVKLDALKTRIFDNAGFNNRKATKKFIEWIRSYNPDVIHLHNLHGYYINVELLFQYLKTCGKKILWTLHDCWAFTGHCAYFDFVGCDKWKVGCEKCAQKKEYPASLLFDSSKRNYQKKKELFTGIPNLTIVTVSTWLKNITEKSFLKDYPIMVIQNGIDHNIFKPAKSNILERYNLYNKKIILGVASTWSARKGLHHFVELSQRLSEDYKIVLIGLSERQIENLPKNILGIRATNSIKELAEWYSAADFFVNPSVEETFGLVTIEAMACGTPAIVFNKTAVPEVVNEACGVICSTNDAISLKNEIESTRIFSSELCIKESMKYNKDNQYKKYIELMLK